MAIKRTPKAEPQLPHELAEHARAAMAHQVARDYFDQKYTDLKKAFFGLIENSTDVTLEVGKSLRFEDGAFRWQSRANQRVNTDKLIDAFNAGKLPLETILSLVSKFNTKALATFIPDAVEDAPATEYGVMVPNAEFRAHIVADLEQLAAQYSGAQPDLEPALRASVAAPQEARRV